MTTNPGVSEVQDKNGVIADIEAKRFDGTRTVQIQGDVTASQTWNGDSSYPLTLNASIGAKKVTQDKIGDKAVGTGQMADGSVGLTQMDPNAMTSSATSGDTRLITAGGVRTEIDNAILNRGKDYGPMTPTQINAISEAIPTGSTVHVTAAGTITDGDIEVRQGEDLKYYRSGNTHYWYSMDGDFKLKQQAKTSPTASGNALSFIDSITQDENGEISATKKTVQDGTTSQKGVVQLEDSHSSTSTTKAATPNSVKSAYDLANTANTGAVKNVAYDSTNKKITKTINGTTTDVVSAATLKTDMALNNVDNTSDVNKPVSTAQQAALDLKLDKTGDASNTTSAFTKVSGDTSTMTSGSKLSAIFGAISSFFASLKALAFKDTVSDSDISGTISDSHIASASTWNGKADKVSGATNGNFAALDSNGNLTDSGKKASEFELVTNKVSAWQGTPDNTHFPSEKLVKDSLDEKANASGAVSFADSVYRRLNETGDGWNKLAETTFTKANTNAIGFFDVYYGQLGTAVAYMTAKFNVRVDGLGSTPMIKDVNYIRVSGLSTYNLCIVVRGLTGNATVELWGYLPKDNISMAVVYRAGTNAQSDWFFSISKSAWTFYNYSGSSTAKPVPDAGNNIQVADAFYTTLQKNIANPTNNNLVAMDASGLVKDSGKAFLPSTSTWDGTSDAKVPTAKAVQAKLDGKQDSLAFMNDSEAVAIWNDAKTAAANAS